MQEFLIRLNIPYLLSRWDSVIPVAALVTLYVIAIFAACHILLVKRDPRAALGWIVVCLGFPGLGVFFYILFGVNRIRTRAKDWQTQAKWGLVQKKTQRRELCLAIGEEQGFDQDTFRSLMHVSNSVTRRPLVPNCGFEIHHNGEGAYPLMLEAIESAKSTVYLSTYIFENNRSGKEFAHALARATERGVDVRVIIDGIGVMFSFPTAYYFMKQLGVRVVLFLPPSLSKRSIHLNLRNHRKILVIDHTVGFTGGMNIGDTHYVSRIKKRLKVTDFHFRVRGAVVEQLEETFFEDWYFVTGERPPQPIEHPVKLAGNALCRGISAGPNEDFEKLRWIVNGAFTCAKKHIRIMTPYFIPDAAMITAIITARLKGVRIEIILPQVNNLPYVGWASQAFLEEFLRYDVQIYFRPTPFAHGKLLVVDDFFVLLGSANMDPRSLRLNFEFNVEVYDKSFAGEMIRHFEDVKTASKKVTLEKIMRRPLLVKLRDSLAKLFSPYL